MSPIRKAIIPAAGFGTRLFPATKVVKKELFPIIDRDGKTKPILLVIIEEAISAGIESIGIVVQPEDTAVFANLFAPPSPSLAAKLSPANLQYCDYLQQLGKKITFIPQSQPLGYGYAVYSAQDWVGDEPFLLLLGDHVYTSRTDVSVSRQLIQVYQQQQQSTIGLTIMPATIIHKAGCVTGTAIGDRLYDLTQIYEKPSIEYARSYLRTPGIGQDQFLAVFGIYILESDIFSYLAADIEANRQHGGEFQLTTCLETLRQQQGMSGYLVDGEYFDTGMPQFYRQTVCDFAGG